MNKDNAKRELKNSFDLIYYLVTSGMLPESSYSIVAEELKNEIFEYKQVMEIRMDEKA